VEEEMAEDIKIIFKTATPAVSLGLYLGGDDINYHAHISARAWKTKHHIFLSAAATGFLALNSGPFNHISNNDNDCISDS
jgi:hypothetical protein